MEIALDLTGFSSLEDSSDLCVVLHDKGTGSYLTIRSVEYTYRSIFRYSTFVSVDVFLMSSDRVIKRKEMNVLSVGSFP